LEIAEFERILAIGLGRAVLHLRAHDSAPYREAVLHACLHDTTYDRQVEGGREQYLFDVIQATGEPGFYRTRLLAAETKLSDDYDGAQILALLRLFAAQGDAEARRCLYDTFAANANTDVPDGSADIVELDGLSGLLAIADRIVIDPDDSWYAGYLINLAAEQTGEVETRAALAAAAEHQPGIAAFLALAWADEERYRNRKSRAEVPDYEAIRARMRLGEREARSLLLRWGRQATDDQLARAAVDLLAEEDPECLHTYLRLFADRRFPLAIARLLALTGDADTRIAYAAVRALANIEDAQVRALGLDLLASGRGDGARLLAANFREGDFALIENYLTTWKGRDELHDLGFGLWDIVDQHPGREATDALLAQYERGPCSLCRVAAVRQLQALGPLPGWLVAECQHDANLDLRADAREYGAQAAESAYT
jgi:hypothetical protein